MMQTRWLAICGIAGSVLFVGAFVIFAMLTPGYDHAVNAVSESGTSDARYPLAWNVIGFILVGLLVTAFGWGLRSGTPSKLLSVLVIVSGIGFTGLGVFSADPGFRASPATTLHFAMVMINYLAFVAGAIVGGIVFRKDALWKRFAIFSVVMAGVGVSSFLIPRSIPLGISQRIGLAAYFVWILGIAYGLLDISNARISSG